MKLASDPEQAAAVAADAIGKLEAPDLLGSGLAGLLASQCIAGNLWPELFRVAFSDAVLRAKVFSVEDQAMLAAVDVCLGVHGSAPFSGRGEPDGAGRRPRLPLDAAQRCHRAARAVAAQTLPVHATLQTLLARFNAPTAMGVALPGPMVLPLALTSAKVSLEVSGPWNRAPLDVAGVGLAQEGPGDIEAARGAQQRRQQLARAAAPCLPSNAGSSRRSGRPGGRHKRGGVSPLC